MLRRSGLIGPDLRRPARRGAAMSVGAPPELPGSHIWVPDLQGRIYVRVKRPALIRAEANMKAPPNLLIRRPFHERETPYHAPETLDDRAPRTRIRRCTWQSGAAGLRR